MPFAMHLQIGALEGQIQDLSQLVATSPRSLAATWQQRPCDGENSSSMRLPRL